jgi:putative membrane protein
LKGVKINLYDGLSYIEMKNDFIIMLKGFIIGSSMSVPGVSGGTMAILLGIYDKLIVAISNFLKDRKRNTLFLLKFCTGAGVGIGSLAFVIQWLLDKFPFPVSFFFLGAVIGGIPALYEKTKESPLKASSGIYFLAGLVGVITIGFLPVGNVNITAGTGIARCVMLLITGIILALALILPGISTSHMLLVLGMYDSMLQAITKFDVAYISLLGIATLIGIFSITKPLEFVMQKFPHQTYCMIIGFVFGSTSKIFMDKIIPAIPRDAGVSWWVPSMVFAVITFMLGYIGILSLAGNSNSIDL